MKRGGGTSCASRLHQEDCRINFFVAFLLCIVTTSAGAQSADKAENITFSDSPGDENITFDDASPPSNSSDGSGNITFGDTEPLENISFDPLDLQGTTAAETVADAEPNDTKENATPLSAEYRGSGSFSRDDEDWWVFETSGRSQLWTIELESASAHRLRYEDPSGDRTMQRRHGRDSAGVLRLPGVLLAAGKHYLAVNGQHRDQQTSYALRAVALGEPPAGAEREPNDDASRANPLSLGETHFGFLDQNGDEDQWAFAIRGRDPLLLTVQPPAGVTLFVVLREDNDNLIALNTGTEGEALRIPLDLPQGDYRLALDLRSASSAEPYRLNLSRLDPFSLPADVEPNDGKQYARELPRDMRISGEVGDWGDRADTWTLGEVPAAGARLEIHPDGDGQALLRRLRLETDADQSDLSWSEATGAIHADLQTGQSYWLSVTRDGPYAFTVSVDPGRKPLRSDDDGALDLALAANTKTVAAYAAERQALPVDATIINTSERPRQVRIELSTSDWQWQAEHHSDEPIELGPGGRRTVPISVHVPSQAGAIDAVRIGVGIRADDGASSSASVEFEAECLAPLSNPQAPRPLPASMLGGMNVALAAFGARPHGDGPARAAELFDGNTLRSNYANLDREEAARGVTVALAGDAAVQVAGVILQQSGREKSLWLKDFDLQLSMDGNHWDTVASGTLQSRRGPQAIALPEPREARFARLRMLSPEDPARPGIRLGEWAVVAVPGATPMEREGMDLALPEFGGHVAWGDPWLGYERGYLLSENEDALGGNLDATRTNVFVLGFQHSRTARIRAIEWQQPSTRSGQRLAERVAIASSASSPTGPWEPLGTWDLPPEPDATATFTLEGHPWVRYLRFAINVDGEDRVFVRLARKVRVFEAPVTKQYRSVLAEWGRESSAGSHELGNVDSSGAADSDAADRREDATALSPGKTYRDNVQIREDTDWFRSDVPASDNRLRLVLGGTDVGRVTATVVDETGREISTEERSDGIGRTLVAAVEGGRQYFVSVAEPVRNIALVWDNSGSVNPFKHTLYPSLTQFAGHVRPGLETVNLLPFGRGRFLLEEWQNDADRLARALADYSRSDSSSDAENAMLVTLKELDRRAGGKAVVFLTDHESEGYRLYPDVWRLMSRVRPAIFTVHLPGQAPGYEQDTMQNYANVNGGYYVQFDSSDDLRHAFDRASCMLRRPARYSIEVTTAYEEPPQPGFIEVAAASPPFNAIEMILDASGSMLQRLEGRRRIEIAREVLIDLTENVVPAGTQLAIRVFGHRKPDACDTELVVPLAPLDAAAVVPVIAGTQALNLARTPIAESLLSVAEDLGDIPGSKLVVLVTDGEETCGGEPAAAIQSLKDDGMNVRINIVGFAIAEEALKAEFESWAQLGGGNYFDAQSAEGLARGLRDALRPKFQVIDGNGEIVAEGVSQGEPVEVPVGRYTVRIFGSPVRTFDDVAVTSETVTTVSD